MGRSNSRDWSVEDARRRHLLAQELRRRLGRGEPLAAPTRLGLGGHVGHDLADVTVHRGPFAGRLAEALGADALTGSQQIVGSAEALDESTAAGRALLGHELAHVAQPGVPADESEQHALAIEASVYGAAQRQPLARRQGVSVDALTDRVYQRLVDALICERERAPWFA